MKLCAFFVVLFLILPIFVFSSVLAQEVNHNIEDRGLINCGKGETVGELSGKGLSSSSPRDETNSLTIQEAITRLSEENEKKRVFLNDKNVKLSCGDEANCITIEELEILSQCDFKDAGNLLLTVVNWLIFIIAPTAVLIMISIGGFMVLVSESANPSMKKRGVDMIKYALLGYIIILSSVLIIDQMIVAIGVTDDSSLLNWKNFIDIL